MAATTPIGRTRNRRRAVSVVAGTVDAKVVFALPGSEHAVRLAMTRLIVPELAHVVQQLSFVRRQALDPVRRDLVEHLVERRRPAAVVNDRSGATHTTCDTMPSCMA